MEKVKFKKKRATCTGLALILSLIFMVSCSSKSFGVRTEVTINLQNPISIDYSKFDKIVYKDFVPESLPKNFDPTEDIRKFFIDDFSRTVEKKIEPWNIESQDQTGPSVLLITGKYKIDIKERSKIKEVSNESTKGKKIRAFVNIQNWEMAVTIIMQTDGKELFKEEFIEKLDEAEAENLKFNFEKLFYTVSSRFLRNATQLKKEERRFILQ